MAYEWQTFVDHKTTLTAKHLDNIQNGILDIQKGLDDVKEMAHAIPLVESTTTDIEPETYQVFGVVDELNVNLVQKDDNLVHEYAFEFIPSEHFTELVITPEVRWANSPKYLSGEICQVSVLRGVAIMIHAS